MVSRWDDEYENHGVWGAIGVARQQIEALDHDVADVEKRESQARPQRVFDYVETALKASDPELVPVALLNQIEGGASQTSAYLQQFETAPDSTFLDQAHGQADALLSYALQLAPRVEADDVQDLQSAVSTFRRSAGQHLRNIEADVGSVRRELADLLTTLREQEAKIQAQDARLDVVTIDV